MARALDDVGDGAGRAVGVIGEAGVGKTALLAAIAEQARARGMLVLEGRAASHERYVPFSLTADVFGQLAGDDHRALRELVDELGGERPVALVLDDLHWADAASMQFVHQLVQRPPAFPHLLAVASRRRGSPALALLGEARRLAGFEELLLEPLNLAASLELLAAVPDARERERLALEARGNPLYLTELARAGGQPSSLPCPVLGAVEVELARLAPALRTLVEGAAVAGDPFDPELAAAAADLPLDEHAVDELVAADLVHLTSDGRAFAFRHPLVRRAVYHMTRPAWRLAAHERVADALERRGASPAARAHHIARSARPGDAAAVALLTEAALAEADPGTAAHWYERALALVVDDDRPPLLAPMGLTLIRAGRLREGRSALAEALDADHAPRIDLVIACSQVDAQLGAPGNARTRLLAAWNANPREPTLAFELAAVASTTAERSEWIRRARTTPIADPVVAAATDALAAVVERDGEALHRVAARLRALDDAALTPRLPAVARIAQAQLELERLGDAADTSERALAIARRARQQQPLVALLEVRAITLLLALDLDGALREIEAAEELARSQGVEWAPWARALILYHRGDAAAAERVADAIAQPDARTACELAAIRDPEHCLRDLAPRIAHLDPVSAGRLRPVLARAALATGRHAEAERWAATTEPALPLSSVRAMCVRSELLLVRGDAGAAARLAEEAVAAAERLPARLDAAEARLLAARAHAAAGDADQAKRALQHVAADAARGQALRLRDAAARELRRLGTRASARAARDGRLSERERIVAELAAQGRSNKQIAAELFLTEGTIENTLTRVYGKLGVGSRTQLAGTLVEAAERNS